MDSKGALRIIFILTFDVEFCTLIDAKGFLGRNINDHIHLIFPHDTLAARPIRLSKKRISVGSLCSEITHNNK